MKSLHPDLLDNAYYRTLFRKEFELGQTLSHSNVVKYVQFHDDERDCYILSEYVCGETLVDKLKSNPGYFASRVNLDKFFNQLLSALKCLHDNHVVYSDLKPQNIMLSQVGNDVKLVDLGYCFTDAYSHTAGSTRGYSAPEQLSNGRLDITTDIYGVGKIIEYIGLNIPHNLPNIYAKIMMQCTKEQQKDRIQDTDHIVKLINRRKHTIRNVILWCVACVALFLAVRTVMYLEVVNAWWDGFEFFEPYVEHDASHGHTYYKVLSEEDGTCAVVEHSSNPNVYILERAEINGKYYRVTQIADSAFRGKTYIRSVYIPEGITHIGVETFLNCPQLVTVNLPNSVVSIDRSAFFDCHQLTHLRISPNLTYLGVGAFSGTNIS
ncbi:MAG: leucine-rich repeat protein, partial [Muribaculaceae bacterium]|nr:leucine-rich repeat protein [Muribaculaceae bacterium]